MALLAALMLPVVVQPTLRAEGVRSGWISVGILGLILWMARTTVGGTRRQRYQLLAFGALAFLAEGARATVSGYTAMDILQAAAWTAFYALLCFLLLQWVFRGAQVTTEKISAAICVYVCGGLVWAGLYRLLLMWRPDAIRFPAGGPTEEAVFYFSFTTLTTLGYGDIVPVHALARSLAYLEAIVGPLFVAVLIARLVALQVTTQAKEEDESGD